MTCREVVEFLTDYLGDVLPAAESRRFDEHVAECPDCVAYLESYRATVRLGRCLCDDSRESPPEGMPEELVQAIVAVRHRTGRNR